jgi:glucans biosynthesis protein
MVLGNLTPKLSTSAGEIRGLSISSLPSGNSARVAFHFLPGNAPMAEFRLSLSNGERTVSEVWLYRWVANP